MMMIIPTCRRTVSATVGPRPHTTQPSARGGVVTSALGLARRRGAATGGSTTGPTSDGRGRLGRELGSAGLRRTGRFGTRGVARDSGDEVSLARLLEERASFTDDVSGADEIMSFVDSPDAVGFADAAHRMAMLYLWNGRVARSLELYQKVFERLIPAGGILYEPEALIWYTLDAFHAGDGDRADAILARLLEDVPRRSPHTRQHAYALRTFLPFARGDWARVASSRQELAELVDGNPETGFCIIGAAGLAYGAVADILSGRFSDGLDEVVARMVPDSPLVQASSVMMPHAMEGDQAAVDQGLKAYGPGLRLWDRERTWDNFDLMPGIALTMLERWDDLRPSLARLDLFSEGGSRVARALAAAIREEEAAAKGGPAPTHRDLQALGCAGLSELLRFRSTSKAAGLNAS